MGQSGAREDARHHLTDPGAAGRAATAVYVVFGTRALDLDWLPAGTPVVIVHNDDRFDRTTLGARAADVAHVEPGRNIGFGAAVNRALPLVATPRVVLVNPDTRLEPVHWRALAGPEVAPGEIVTVPLVDGAGRPTVVQSRHYTPLTLALSAWRAGRFVPGRRHRRPLARTEATAAETWVSGACVSFETALLREAGGFDERFFLYFEDADLGRRIATRYPATRVRTADVPAGVHAVGGSVSGPGEGARSGTGPTVARLAEVARAESARRYAAGGRGPAWGAATLAASARVGWLRRTAR